jgi:branched-chain amino acid transport system ATP-binding protein
MSALLVVDDVTVRFGGLVALSNVSFSLQAGEIVGLIGPNGAGKTTLFSTLAGLVRPRAGSVTLNGARVDGLPPHAITRRGMTKTFQNTALFADMTLADNVMTAAVVGQSMKQAAALTRMLPT